MCATIYEDFLPAGVLTQQRPRPGRTCDWHGTLGAPHPHRPAPTTRTRRGQPCSETFDSSITILHGHSPYASGPTHQRARAAGARAESTAFLTALPCGEPVRHAPARPCMQYWLSGARQRRGGSRSLRVTGPTNVCLSVKEKGFHRVNPWAAGPLRRISQLGFDGLRFAHAPKDPTRRSLPVAGGRGLRASSCTTRGLRAARCALAPA